MCDEWPKIAYPNAYNEDALEYEVLPGRIFCVEALVAEEDSSFSTMLDDQVLITEDVFENLTIYPHDDELIAILKNDWSS